MCPFWHPFSLHSYYSSFLKTWKISFFSIFYLHIAKACFFFNLKCLQNTQFFQLPCWLYKTNAQFHTCLFFLIQDKIGLLIKQTNNSVEHFISLRLVAHSAIDFSQQITTGLSSMYSMLLREDLEWPLSSRYRTPKIKTRQSYSQT